MSECIRSFRPPEHHGPSFSASVVPCLTHLCACSTATCASVVGLPSCSSTRRCAGPQDILLQGPRTAAILQRSSFGSLSPAPASLSLVMAWLGAPGAGQELSVRTHAAWFLTVNNQPLWTTSARTWSAIDKVSEALVTKKKIVWVASLRGVPLCHWLPLHRHFPFTVREFPLER